MTPEIFKSIAQGLLGAPEEKRPEVPIGVPASVAVPDYQKQAMQLLANSPLSNENAAAKAPNVAAAGAAVDTQINQKQTQMQAQAALAQVNQVRLARGQPPLTPQDAQNQNALREAPNLAKKELDEMMATAKPTAVDPNESDASFAGVQRDANGVPMTPEALLQDIEQKRKTDLASSDQIAKMERIAAADTAKADRDIARASEAPEQELHGKLQKEYDDLALVQKEVDEHAQNAITEYKTVNDKMMKLAESAPKDIWGQSGMNQMLGTVSIFFGGFGVNGNHANHNLEQINNMADRNIAAQKAQFEQLAAVGQGDKTLYGMLQQRLQNAQAVSGTMKNMAQQSYLSQLRSVANKYADPKFKAAVETQAAAIKKDQVGREQLTAKTYVDESTATMKMIGAEKARQEILRLKTQKEEQYKIKGYTGHALNPTEHRELAKVVAGGRGMIQSLNHMEAMINAGATVAAIREYMTESAGLFKGARDYLETGTRIEEGEQKIINQLMVAPGEAIASSWFGRLKNSSGVMDKISAIRHMIREGMDQKVTTYAPDMVPDENDSLTGHLLDVNNSSEEKLNPGGKAGQSVIDDLPNADGSKPIDPAADTGAVE